MPTPRLSLASTAAILALAASALAAPAADAQVRPGRTDVSGTVVNARTGAPLSGATVCFINLRRSVATDEAGRFEFRSLPAGEQTVAIQLLGYEAVMELWEIGRDGAGHQTMNVELDPQPIVLEGLRVQVDRLERRRRSLGVSARVLEQDALRGASGQNALGALTGRMGIIVVPCRIQGPFAGGRDCVLVRGTTTPPAVFIDERRAMGGLDELTGYLAHEIYRIEAIGGGRHIRVYTNFFMETIATQAGYRPNALLIN
jgi:hypothetical protein